MHHNIISAACQRHVYETLVMVKRTVLAERQSKDLAACAAITGQHVSMDGWNTLPSEMNETRIKPDNIQMEMGPYVNETEKQMENSGLV